ncbi:MAG: dihydrolipoyl dehydrogenase [Verrucomicrobia bacterium]|nr:dihydrolipoyl dehydrogenase [Verrucomicrobiota bacterium]
MTEKFDVIVIGSGPAGYVAAIRCGQLGLKTACVEKGELGGTCLNIGCIPSKALLHSSDLYYQLEHHFPDHGVQAGHIAFDFDKMMNRKKEVVKGFTQGVGALFQKNKVVHLKGTGILKSPTIVSVNGTDFEASSIILATGSEPIRLPFLPIDEKRIVTSTGALALESIPQKMIVVGAGAIGVELGSVYSRLGSNVTFVEFLPKICPTMDEVISKNLQQILEKQGMTFHLNSKVVAADGTRLTVEKEGQKMEMEANVVLCSIGRRPYTTGLGLENVGITPNEKGFIPINGRFQTKIPNIFAIGDIIDGPMLAHKAFEEGVAVAELIAGGSPIIEYMAIPNVVYTNPEVAAVGLTEAEAKAMGLNVKTGSFPFKINSRAKCTGETEGMVKIVADGITDRILGVHILGAHASEIIAEGVVAIEKKMTSLELGNAPHAHPTFSEAVKEAALAVHGRPIHR